jgi:hypothetical protein
MKKLALCTAVVFCCLGSAAFAQTCNINYCQTQLEEWGQLCQLRAHTFLNQTAAFQNCLGSARAQYAGCVRYWCPQ